MLKKKAKIRKRLARIVLAALLCSGGLHGLAVPSVAEAATTITVSNITGDAATGVITVTADPAGSMVGQYISEAGVFRMRPDAALAGISEINITGSTIPAYCMGSNPDSADAGSRTVTVSGANTVLGGVYANAQNGKNAAEANNNTLIIEDARITGIDRERPAQVYAGASEKVGASGNRVEIRNAKVGQEEISIGVVAAGVADNGNATGNQVTVEGEAARIYGVVVGGVADNGNATGNQVDISNGEVVFTPVTDDVSTGEEPAGDDVGKVFTVAGGLAQNGEAAGNRVNISGGTVGVKDGQVVGGYASQTASGNTVTIKGGNVLNGAYGGYSESGAVTGNALNIEGGIIYAGADTDESVSFDTFNLAGGDSKNGVASGNTLTITGGRLTGDVTAVAGGHSSQRDAEQNRVTISGGTNVQLVYGGASDYGNTNSNEVYIHEGAAVGLVFGGQAYIGGDAKNNLVTITGGTVGKLDEEGLPDGGVTGGDSRSGTAGFNTVNMTGGSVTGDVDGGYSESGTASSNTVNMTGGSVLNGSVIGGFNISGTASSNTVNMTGGSVTDYVIGGYSESGTAESNTVNIDGGNVTGDVYGGDSRSGTASSNTVNIKGGSVTNNVIGGYSESGTAANNTVNILTPMQAAGLVGGFGDPAKSTGNTLNIAAKNVTTTKAGYFQNMNFYLPADIANGDTMLTIKGYKDEETRELSGNDLTGVTFGVTTQPGVDLLKGDTVNLVFGEQGLVTDDTLATTTSMTAPKDIATDTNYQLSISKKDDNTIMATVTDRQLSPNDKRMATTGKSTAETRAAVSTQINAGADLIAGMGMANASDAAAGSSGGMEPFAAMGLSSLRAQSGSHVDTKGIGLALGFARELKNKSGKFLVGPLVEYGYGRYDSYQDDGSKADGKSHYWGFGVIAKQTNDNGLYYEGSLRIGRAKSDYDRDDAVFGRMGYDSDSTYWGAHLGIGKVQDIGHDSTLDFYGKYFYSHTGGDTVFVRGLNAMADFGSVDSHRLRVGTRLTHAVNEKNRIYGGLAYQYEFNGDAKVTYNPGGTAPSPSVKGSSGMLELGWQVKPGRSPMVIDLGVSGWVGKQRGITANLQANWTF